MKQSDRFWLILFAGVFISFFSTLMGGGWDHNDPFWTPILSIGVALLGIATLFQNNQTVKILTGLTMLGYGIWWIFMPQIECETNILTWTFIGTGALVLLISYMNPAKTKKDQFSWKFFKYYLVIVGITALIAYIGWG